MGFPLNHIKLGVLHGFDMIQVELSRFDGVLIWDFESVQTQNRKQNSIFLWSQRKVSYDPLWTKLTSCRVLGTHRSLSLCNCAVRLVYGVLAQCLQGKPGNLEAQQRKGCGCALLQRHCLALPRMQSTTVIFTARFTRAWGSVFWKIVRLVHHFTEYIYSVCSLVLRDSFFPSQFIEAEEMSTVLE